MRPPSSVLIAWLVLVAPANAQTVNSNAIDCKGFDDGGYENCWKVSNPSGPSDFFNVDFNADCAGAKVVAICVEICETDTGGLNGLVGVFPDDLSVDPTGTTPDLSSPITQTVNPTGLPGTFCTDLIAYDVPDVTLGSTNVHAVYGFDPGDFAAWVCADTMAPAGRSFFTADGYSTPAIPFTLNWAIRIGAIPAASGVLWINGGTTTTIEQDGGLACFLFTGCTTGVPFLIFLSNCSGGLLFISVPFILFTGFGAVDDGGNTASVCGNYACTLPAPLTVCFIAVYADLCDLKPNGNPRLKLSNEVTLNITASKCGASDDFCFGQHDDGILDSTIWKVRNPAGSGNYFNVHYGTGAATNLTSIEMASWDFCGTGPSWGGVLSAEADTVFDASGGTPNIRSPVASATTLRMGPAQSDWAYPATFYDYPDVAYGGQDLHGVAHWKSGDSCIWIGSDTDFLDGTCGVNGDSYFSLDSYRTRAIQFFGAAWMIKQDWN